MSNTGGQSAYGTTIEQLSISVLKVYARPIVSSESFIDLNSKSLLIPSATLLSSAYTADGDLLTVQALNGPSHGTLTQESDGSFAYSPESGWSGVDHFTFTAFNGPIPSAPAIVTVTVLPPSLIGRPPVSASQTPSILGVGIPGDGDFSGLDESSNVSRSLQIATLVSGDVLETRPAQSGPGSNTSLLRSGYSENEPSPSNTGPPRANSSQSVLPAVSGGSHLRSTTGPASSALVDSSIAPVPIGTNVPSTFSTNPTVGVPPALARTSEGAIDVKGPSFSTELHSLLLDSRQLALALDQMSDGMIHGRDVPLVTVTVVVGMTVSVGYVVWTARASYLLAALLAASPLWREFDPLSILEESRNQGTLLDHDEDEEGTDKSTPLALVVERRSLSSPHRPSRRASMLRTRTNKSDKVR